MDEEEDCYVADEEDEVRGVVDEERDGPLIELGKEVIAAARDGDISTLNQLIQFNAPYVTDWLGLTALHHAASEGHLEVVKTLIRSGNNMKDVKSKVGKTALHMASQEGHTHVVKYLISQGAQVNQTDMFRMTALHWATDRGHEETVSTLLQNGASIIAIDKFNRTCQCIAHVNRNQQISSLLQRGNFVGPHTTFPQIYCEFSRCKPVKKLRVDTVESESPRQDNDAWQLLEEHGVEMLEGEDATLVAAALGSGQRVVLTEAGRQALHHTTLDAQSSTQDTKSHDIAPHTSSQLNARLAKEICKFRQAKQRLKLFKTLYKKKIYELENLRRNCHAQEAEVLRCYATMEKILRGKPLPLNAMLSDSDIDVDSDSDHGC